MKEIFSEAEYESMLSKLFVRFPSFQKVGAGAYKPGTGNMEFFDQLAGHPHRQYKLIHVAGTNGKGSVSNMLTSALASQGLKVGLYTSPHILDFRERMRMVDENGFTLIPKDYVWNFVNQWQETFDHLDMSFFEITTAMALSWFAEVKADVVVLETGLGGRLDSTNIVTPVLSVITNIGLDHCDMLGLMQVLFIRTVNDNGVAFHLQDHIRVEAIGQGALGTLHSNNIVFCNVNCDVCRNDNRLLTNSRHSAFLLTKRKPGLRRRYSAREPSCQS